jgi:hypothetical protein
MSNRYQSAQGLRQDHHSTFHAFFLAAKESGYKDFDLQLVTSPNGKIEFCIRAREHSEMSAKFEVRGNTVRAAPGGASVVPADETDVGINYGGTPFRGGTRSGFTGHTLLASTSSSCGDRPRPTEDGLESLVFVTPT